MSNRPYIALHMLTSINGKITGCFLSSEIGTVLCEEYYRINREYNSDGFICDRITMEGSFTGKEKPDLSLFSTSPHEDFVAKTHGYYAVSIDPHGRLCWKDSEIHDLDPGYDNAHIIEVLTENVDDRYPTYLKSLGISYIFCGGDSIDVEVAVKKLFKLFGIKFLLLEGGGLTNTLFQKADLIDELSIVVVPLVENGKDAINLFESTSSTTTTYELLNVKPLPQNGLLLNYKKGAKND